MSAATRVFLRPIADPMALGFMGLAGATISMSGLELGWVPASQQHQIGFIVVVFAPLLQVIACVFGFLGRDAVAATGMGVLAGTWAVIGGEQLLTAPGTRSAALGTFLLLAGAAVFNSALTAAQSKLVAALVMTVTGTRFITTGVYDLTGVEWVKTAAGVVGCLLAAVAVYAAVALEIEAQRHHAVLPTLRRGRGESAMHDGLPAQVAEVANEAGVRSQL